MRLAEPRLTRKSLTPSIAGLTFDPINVALNGTPTVPGTFPLTATVTDSAGLTASNKSLTLIIAPAALGIHNHQAACRTPR